VPTLRLFEQTGRISLIRLLALASVLGIGEEFERLATPPQPMRSLAKLEASYRGKTRQRGRTQRSAEEE